MNRPKFRTQKSDIRKKKTEYHFVSVQPSAMNYETFIGWQLVAFYTTKNMGKEI